MVTTGITQAVLYVMMIIMYCIHMRNPITFLTNTTFPKTQATQILPEQVTEEWNCNSSSSAGHVIYFIMYVVCIIVYRVFDYCYHHTLLSHMLSKWVTISVGQKTEMQYTLLHQCCFIIDCVLGVKSSEASQQWV